MLFFTWARDLCNKCKGPLIYELVYLYPVKTYPYPSVFSSQHERYWHLCVFMIIFLRTFDLIQWQFSTFAGSISKPISSRTCKVTVLSPFFHIFWKFSDLQTFTSGVLTISPTVPFKSCHFVTELTVPEKNSSDSIFLFFFLNFQFIFHVSSWGA